MTIENLNRKDVKDIYLRNQRGSERLPFSAELADRWTKGKITVKELWDLNPQFYVGYRLNDKKENDSGFLTQKLWETRDHSDTKAKSILTAYKALKEQKNLDPKVVEQLEQISEDLGKLALENEDYPIILLNSYGVVPYPTGNTIDGVRRLISLFDQYTAGNIQDSAEVNVIVGEFPRDLCILYNVATAAIDNKSVEEKQDLFVQRTFDHEDIDILSHID